MSLNLLNVIPNAQSNVVNQIKAPLYNQKNYLLPNRLTVMRSTIATVDLEKIRHNVKVTKEYVQRLNPQAKLMAIVKANAYGHGAVNVVPDMLQAGADWLGVATMDEAIELRENHITAPILLLGVWEPHVAQMFFDYDITPVVFSFEALQILNENAKIENKRIKVHIKVDTGMGRVGFSPADFKKLQNLDFFIENFSHLFVEGVMTHLSSADMASELQYTREQTLLFKELYNEFVEFLPNVGYEKGYKPISHFSNSSTCLKTEKLDFVADMYRAGDVLYGGKRGEYDGKNWFWDHRPALEFSSAITQIKEFGPGASIGYCRTFKTTKENTKIATIPVGYADGIFNSYSNKGKMIVVNEDGEEFECPIRGNVCMDLLMIEVTDVENVKVGNKVFIIGKGITQETVGEIAGVNPSAVTCAIGLRVPRLYINSAFQSKIIQNIQLETKQEEGLPESVSVLQDRDTLQTLNVSQGQTRSHSTDNLTESNASANEEVSQRNPIRVAVISEDPERFKSGQKKEYLVQEHDIQIQQQQDVEIGEEIGGKERKISILQSELNSIGQMEVNEISSDLNSEIEIVGQGLGENNKNEEVLVRQGMVQQYQQQQI